LLPAVAMRLAGLFLPQNIPFTKGLKIRGNFPQKYLDIKIK
jgi:hypothetical protein